MLRRNRANPAKNRGDTLVEVLFATATAALIIVITLVVMNRNLAQIQMGVETTFARQAIDSQAEVLRYLRGQYESTPNGSGAPQLWRDLVDPSKYGQTAATDFGSCQPDENGNLTGQAGNRAFYVKNSSGGLSKAESDAADIQNITLEKTKNTSFSETYARPGQGLWIESINPSFNPAQTIRYVDFHLRACWDPPFEGSKATLGTIVRLYYETTSSAIDTPPRVCGDGVDNPNPPDDDEFPVLDADDPGCHYDGDVNNPASYEADDNNEANTPPLPACDNDRDDDGDTDTDFPADSGCTSPADVDESNLPPFAATISPDRSEFPAWHMLRTKATPGTVTKKQTFTVKNPEGSSGPLTITDTPISGPDNSSFNITANNCLAVTLAPGGPGCDITVEFYPPSGSANNRLANAGLKSATLTVNNSDRAPSTTAALSGRAVTDRMAPGDVFYADDSQVTFIRGYTDGCYNNALGCTSVLALFSTGNLAFYPDSGNGIARWMTGGTGANRAAMQADGNLVMYNSAGVNVRNVFITNRPGTWVLVGGNGRLALMGPNNSWDSGTYSPDYVMIY